ncbi:MAG: TonB-dependent receptor [Niabella sp.]|nr:TonB-dependent receptor [Niabella sp.]
MKKIILLSLMAWICIVPKVFGQQRAHVISGTVFDENAAVLKGATIIEQGTRNGVMANNEGQFTITLRSKKQTIEVTHTGYLPKIIVLKESENSIDVYLEPDASNLNNVVVVGYGTQKKASLVGAISQVSAEDLKKSFAPNLTNSLAGRVAGVITVMGSGKPGDDASKIYVRGMATTNNTDPLVLVDGAERDWAQIDPADIETFSVLKDASATAVFGVRGANGVILITTKRGQKGKPALNITSRSSLQSPIRLPNYLGSYDFAVLTNEALRNEGKPEEYTQEDLEHYRLKNSPYTHPDNDYYRDFLRKASFQQNVNLSARGGTDFLSYYISGSILHQEGMYKTFDNTQYNTNSNFDRYNFRSNLDFNLTPTTKLGVDLTGRLETRRQPNFDQDLFDKTRRLPPNYQAYINPNGTIGGRSDESRLAPYALLGFFGNRSRYTNVLEGVFNLNQKLDKITKGLSARGQLSFNSSFKSKYDIREKPELWQYDKFGAYTKNKERTDLSYFTEKGPATRRIALEYALNYSRTFDKDHAVTGMLLYQQSQYWNEYDIPIGYQGTVGRVTYGFRSKYLFEFNAGYNGSVQFSKAHRYGLFPALSLGWVPTEEGWLPKNNILNYLKIRGSYGEVGNDKIGDFKYLYEQRYNLLPNEDGWNIKWGETGGTTERAIAEGQPGNGLVTWERARKSNIGFDAKLFKSKVSLTVDLFREYRNDILAIPYSVPLVYGMNNPQNSERKDGQGLPPENLGIVKNKGFEVELGYNSNGKNINYFVKGNFTFARNKIYRIDEEGKKYDWQKKEGKRIGQHFGLTDIGLFQREDFLMNDNGDLILIGGYPSLKPGIPVPSFGVVYPGDARYADLNGDGIIDSYDIGAIGHGTVPEYVYGVNMGISWKNLDLSILFQGAGNAEFYFKEDAVWEFFAQGKVMQQHLGRYRNDDPSTWTTATYPLLHPAENTNNMQKTTRWLFTRDYLRLKNAELGFTFPRQVLNRIHLTGLRVFVSGNNLITWDKMMNWDPESGSETGNQYPQLRLWNFGISVNF